MRKLSFFLVLIATSLTYVQAQKYIGVRGGLSIPNLYAATDDEISKDYKSLLAGNTGFLYEAPFIEGNDHWYMMVELDFSRISAVRKGSQPIIGESALPLYNGLAAAGVYRGGYLYGDFENKAIFDFISIPVMMKHYWGTDVRFYLAGGLSTNILMTAENFTKGQGPVTYMAYPMPQLGNIPFDGKRDIKKDVHPVNFSAILAAGITFPTGKNYFFVDGRFDFGLLPMQTDKVNGRSHPGAGIVSLGYAIAL